MPYIQTFNKVDNSYCVVDVLVVTLAAILSSLCFLLHKTTITMHPSVNAAKKIDIAIGTINVAKGSLP